ncbi:MAG TPA: 3-methyl-2-oxobutanoate hydroxymethyltransferase [Thermodesulfobacteriota bacterium]|nr:3-methyl-2-oxobutanoate hydroxymethyltransferase [Thermodesulfobacteriota bacterium]
MERKKVTPQDLLAKKQQGRKIVRVVCYDYPMALLADRAEVDSILVGDSVGMVVGGMASTVPVTMEEMIYHCRIVMRAVKYALVIGDLPFLSYQTDKRDAIYNAGLLMKSGGVDAVKLEGGKEFAPTVKAIVEAGIPVVGHIGLTPQTVSKLGGFKVQGTDTAAARKLVEDALSLESAGIFMLTLECVPDRLGEFISKKLKIPVTGIGSGPYTDGQTLNLYDLVGLFEKFTPKFVKKYANLSQEILKALQNYKDEVEKGVFPGSEHSFHMKDEVLKEVIGDPAGKG